MSPSDLAGKYLMLKRLEAEHIRLGESALLTTQIRFVVDADTHDQATERTHSMLDQAEIHAVDVSVGRIHRL